MYKKPEEKQEELEVPMEQQIKSLDQHFTRNEIEEMWGIIGANCQKISILLEEEVKEKFEDAFEEMDNDDTEAPRNKKKFKKYVAKVLKNKKKFEDAFENMSGDVAELLENIDTDTIKPWTRFKESFDKFKETIKPFQDSIAKTAKEIWGKIVQMYKIVVEYCDHKAEESSIAVLKQYSGGID